MGIEGSIDMALNSEGAQLKGGHCWTCEEGEKAVKWRREDEKGLRMSLKC